MAKKYSGGIALATGFKIQNTQAVADYMVVELISDLTNTTNLPNQFVGMVTFVLEDQNSYILKSTGWEKYGIVFTGETTNTFVTANTFNNATYDLTLTRNDGISLTSNLSILSSDMVVTGGTYNINTGIVNFTNNSGGTFDVSGFTSGMTDTYTTGGTYSNGTTIFTKSDGVTYSVSGYSTGSTTNLQQAYNNSTQPEIVTNSTLGALSIQNGTGSADNITNLFETQNSASTKTAIIRADGYISGTTLQTNKVLVNTITDNGDALQVNGTITAVSIDCNLGNSNKGLVVNSGLSSTGNPIEVIKDGVTKLVVNQAGELTATKLIKDGGTSSQILAADGSVIIAGTNITITGGQISSVGGTGGGGSSVNYYLNGGTSQGTFGGTTYYEFSKTAIIGTGADFNISSNGYIASFITDVADPSLLLIPAGNWNLEFFFSSSSAGGSPSFYVELYKYDGTTFTLIASSSVTPEAITNGTTIDAYFTPLAVPETVLTVNDRLAIRVFVNVSSKTITLHTQNGHLCEVITTFTAGLTALNGLQAQVQNFATGTTGDDFAINSSGSTHTFNLPSASATARGVVTTGSQTFAGDKTFTGAIGASNLSNTNTGDNATNTQYSGLATSKQDTLQSTVNIKTINGTSLLGSGDITINGGGGLALTVRKISTNTTLAESDNGTVILLTASCTVTLPNALSLGFNCSFVTSAGATMTYSLGNAIVLINNAFLTMGEKLSHTITNTGVANEYITVGL